LENLNDAIFIREGSQHSAKEAAEHVRKKLGNAGGRIKTASEFIDQIASKSSLSGQEYEIRFSDGRTLPASAVLREELSKMEKSH
jgi:hypothetical protein